MMLIILVHLHKIILILYITKINSLFLDYFELNEMFNGKMLRNIESYKSQFINDTCNTIISMQKTIGIVYLSAKKYT